MILEIVSFVPNKLIKMGNYFFFFFSTKHIKGYIDKKKINKK